MGDIGNFINPYIFFHCEVIVRDGNMNEPILLSRMMGETDEVDKNINEVNYVGPDSQNR